MTLHQLPIANKERVIIVGAGIGGLAASLRLSHMGYNVKVFETAETAGGKLRTITGQTGEIDIGPTVLTLLPVFQNLFRSVGEDIFDHIELVRQKIIARHWWPDGETLDLHDDFESSRDAILNFSGPESAKEFEKKFLGQIPINSDVGKYGDMGIPIVEKDPDHEITKIYLKFALM